MSSPFPGMDPYLEGYLWPDVHQSLAGQFKRQLSPLLRSRYVVRLAVYFVSDMVPAHEVGIVYPDVEVVRPKRKLREVADWTMDITPPALFVPATIPLEVRLTSVQVRDTANNELITSIEILSPTNKREPGLGAYRQKRAEFIQAGVHLLELDLIRRGQRPWLPEDEDVPPSPYLALLTRAGQPYTELWPIQLWDSLPVLPVPLRAADADVPLDVQTALAIIYDESDYGRTVDYRQPPPKPVPGEEEALWLDEHLQEAGLRP